MEPEVSVIIVNYRTSDLVADCIESIFNHTTDITFEIIVVDNNTEPDLESKLSLLFPDKINHIKCVSLPDNIGFGRANNEGMKISKGRNIFFLNPDTLLLNNAIKILSDFLDNHPDTGACGGNLFDADLKPTFSFKRFFPGIRWETNELLNSKPQKILFGKNCYFNTTNHPIKVAFVSGADLMVKREVLEKTMLFSDAFFLYYEETDLCRRISKAGWKIYNIPSAKIMHLESKSMGEDGKWESEFKTQWMERSRKIYYKRNVSPLNRVISDFIYNLFLNSRIELIRKKNKKEYYLTRKKYYKSL